LRQGIEHVPEHLRGKAAAEAAAIQETMRPLASETEVWRGMGKELFTGSDDGLVNERFDWQDAVGRSFVDRGFVSTSTDETAAAGWDFKGALAEIRVAPGVRAALVEDIGANANILEEHELLLQPGLSFRVVSAERVEARWQPYQQV